MSAIPLRPGHSPFLPKQGPTPGTADTIYASARKIDEANMPAYLKRKNVGAYNIRIGVHPDVPDQPCVVVPLYNKDRQITNIQFIFDKPVPRPDGETDKLFIGKAQKKGRFCPIGPDLWGDACTNTVVLAEGYATAATVFEAVGWTTVVALDAGNLKYVSEIVRSIIGPQRRILIAADNDHVTGNTGAVGAADAIYRCGGGAYVVPPFTLEEIQAHGKTISDFNDLARIRSMDSVRQAILDEASWERSTDRPRVTLRDGAESVSVANISTVLKEPKPNESSEGPYQSAGTLVYVFNGRLKAYDGTYLQQVVSERVDVRKEQKTTLPKATAVPETILRMLLKPENTTVYKPLGAVVNAPAALRPDGTLAVNAGYDEQLGVYITRDRPDDPDWSMEDLPPLEDCKATLMGFYRDFRVKDEFHCLLLISHLLTILTAHLTPTRPGYLLTAADAGMGKTTAVRCNFIIAGIEPLNSPTPPLRWMDGDEYKLEQEVAAALRMGKYPYFDNVLNKASIEQACFARWITSETVFFRLLSKTEAVTLRNTWVFTWTGNNVDATGDMARRAVTVEFNGRNVIEDGGFPIEDPLTYAHDHRADLLRAALGLLSHTLRDPGASVLEADKIGFPEWRRYVAGPILRAFGEDITRSVREHYVEAQADDRDRLAVAAMAAVLELDRNYRAKEIADAFNGYSKEGNEVLDLLGYTTHERGKIAANSIGARVKKLKGKRSPDGKVTLTYEHQKGENVYLIRLASAGPGSPGEKAPV